MSAEEQAPSAGVQPEAPAAPPGAAGSGAPAKASKKKASKKQAEQVIGLRCVKAFIFNGVQLHPGDVFVADELACSALRLRQLQSNRKVSGEIITGSAPDMSTFTVRNLHSREALARAKGEAHAEKVAPRARLL